MLLTAPASEGAREYAGRPGSRMIGSPTSIAGFASPGTAKALGKLADGVFARLGSGVICTVAAAGIGAPSAEACVAKTIKTAPRKYFVLIRLAISDVAVA